MHSCAEPLQASRLAFPLRRGPLLRAALLAGCIFAAFGLRADPPADGEWAIAWQDEFEGKKVDESKWEVVGDWKRRDAWWLKETTSLDGEGHLVVRSLSTPAGYACGGLRSRGKYTHAFGYYEIRAKVPREVGTWAAFWLYDDTVGKVGDGGRDGTEIDIFEAVWRDREEVNIALHWDGYGKEHRSWGEKVKTPGLSKDFHTFGLLWTPEEYVFFYDGKELKRSREGGVCQVPLYLKVTTEIGTWAGDIKKAKLPDEFVVDWVRVWDRKPAPSKSVEKSVEKTTEKGTEKADEAKKLPNEEAEVKSAEAAVPSGKATPEPKGEGQTDAAAEESAESKSLSPDA